MAQYSGLVERQDNGSGRQGITRRLFIGSVLILSDQLISFYDERGKDGCVRLVCTDPRDDKVIIWHNLVKTGDVSSPVKVSNTPVRAAGTNMLIFAVGLRVFLVKFRQQEARRQINVGSISSLKVGDVEPGSWISSINAHFSLEGENNIDYFVSLYPRPELRGYKVTGELIKTVGIGPVTPSITHMASTENMYAAICPGNDDVLIIKSAGSPASVRRCGSLKPSSRGIGIQAVAVIWTGSMWMVLGVNRATSTWTVLVYRKTGEFLKICEEGSYQGILYPECVTRFGNSGLVSFADGNTRSFKF